MSSVYLWKYIITWDYVSYYAYNINHWRKPSLLCCEENYLHPSNYSHQSHSIPACNFVCWHLAENCVGFWGFSFKAGICYVLTSEIWSRYVSQVTCTINCISCEVGTDRPLFYQINIPFPIKNMTILFESILSKSAIFKDSLCLVRFKIFTGSP